MILSQFTSIKLLSSLSLLSLSLSVRSITCFNHFKKVRICFTESKSLLSSPSSSELKISLSFERSTVRADKSN
jgi:hypothetical protein